MPSRPLRVLATSNPSAGHFTPMLPVLRTFVDRGDDVLVVASPGLAPLAEANGMRFQSADEPAAEAAAIWERVPNVSRSEAAVLVNRDIFGRLNTDALLPTIDGLCASWQPDLLLHEAAEFAAAVASERHGIPHVQVAIGLAGVEAASVEIAEPALRKYSPDLAASLLGAPYVSRLPASLDPSAYTDTRRFRQVEPAGETPLDDAWGDAADPLVYVSFGTVAGRLPVGELVYPSAVSALAGLRIRGLVTMGRTRGVAEIGAAPSHVRVTDWVDQANAVEAASVVVCHGGAGTTFGALAAGKPVVVVPLMADQFTNGRIAAASGAGVVVPTEDPDDRETPLSERLRAALSEVLENDCYRVAARRVAAEMADLPDLDEVVEDMRRTLPASGPFG